ncbi:MAG: DUF3160 domain-containing protein [Chloroflexota bacterium]
MLTTKSLDQSLLTVICVAVLTLGGCARLTGERGVSPVPSTTLGAATVSPVTVSPVLEEPTSTPTRAPETTPVSAPTSPPARTSKLLFASFEKPKVEAEPVIHHQEIAPDLGNVRNAFLLSQEQIDRLAANGFVVSLGAEREFFTLYEKARYENVPIFVTSDSVLHIYHLLFSKVLRTAEVEHFIPLLMGLNQAVLHWAEEDHQALRGTEWEEPARRTVAFIGVGARLLSPETEVPDYVADLVDEQVALIEEGKGIGPSPVLPTLEHGEDYTQYKPRGHYTKSDALEAYFRSMMWYGRMTFRLKTEDPDVGRTETRSALLLVQALRSATVNGRPALESWADLYSSTVFFVGRSDDLTVLQYGEVMDEIYGENVQIEDLIDDDLLEQFIAEADRLPPPRILGMVIGDWEDVEEETKGLRFMGQRFVPDAFIFRQLIYRNVGQATPPHRRGLPNGLDIPAAMGSDRAYEILEDSGETDFDNYDEQMARVREWLSGLSVEEWTETLYNSWLYCFDPLLEEPGDGYPFFMRSVAWVDKQLNTVQGSFAELKHDTILYAKQAYAELGGAPPPPPPAPPRGYVEPVPEFYARLAALTEMTRDGLASRGLLVERDEASLQRLGELVDSLQTMAEKELRGEPLTEAEYETIRFYGGELEHLTMASSDTSEQEPALGGQMMPEDEPQAAVIADVATDPDPKGDGTGEPTVLELAVGRIDQLYAVVPLAEADGSTTLQVAKGGVFSYYEFSWPADDRLTDEQWREMLGEGTAPSRPEWIDSFVTREGEYAALRRGVQGFQESLVDAFWYVDPNQLSAGEELAAELTSEVEAFRAEQQHVGRRLLSVDFRSFDRQSDDLAVVTVREAWKDTLYEGVGPGDDEEPLAERGPYSLDVTYTLQLLESGRWQVTRAVCDDSRPNWQ